VAERQDRARATSSTAFIELARRYRGPLIEPTDDPATCRVTFVYIDTSRRAERVGLLCPALPHGFALLQALGDHTYAGSFPIPVDARVKYGFCPDPPAAITERVLRELRESPAAARVDTFNPLLDVVSVPELGLRMFESVLAMPAAPAAAATRRRQGTATGAVDELVVHSDALRGERTVTVYRPPSHETDGKRLPLVLLLDGQQDWWQTPALFHDLLTSGTSDQFLGVAVGSRRFTSRLRDLAGNPDFVRFVVDELLPLLASRYGLPDDDHVVAGFSAGGLGASYLALREPRRFSRLIVISGGFHLTIRSRMLGPQVGRGDRPWLVDEYERSTAPPPGRAYLAAGQYEASGDLDVPGQTARLAQILRQRGADVRLEISPTDHNTITARIHLARGIAWLLSPAAGDRRQ
jgi:enterochelin esterase-like enzyme